MHEFHIINTDVRGEELNGRLCVGSVGVVSVSVK